MKLTSSIFTYIFDILNSYFHFYHTFLYFLDAKQFGVDGYGAKASEKLMTGKYMRIYIMFIYIFVYTNTYIHIDIPYRYLYKKSHVIVSNPQMNR
jgi:hypothetical protein